MDLHDRMRNEVETQKTQKEEQYKEISKTRLTNILTRKQRTTFIGAICAIEEEFGYLWGHNSTSPLTESQKKMQFKWQRLRNKIMNNGNNQLRAVENEINQYDITWNRYSTNLLVKPEDNNV